VRDPVYIDDVVAAFLLAASEPAPPDRMLNVGGSDPLPLSEIAKIVSDTAGAPEPVLRPFPEDRKRIDIGSYTSDTSRIRAHLGWKPATCFPCGIKTSLAFFRAELPYYLPDEDAEPVCPLEKACVLEPDLLEPVAQ
jgi:UDP-glucose 4-epimerase